MLPRLKTNTYSTGGEIISIREQRISILEADSQNEKQFFLNRSFAIAYFQFWDHAPENEIFLSISGKTFHFRSRFYKFGSMNLTIYLSINPSV